MASPVALLGPHHLSHDPAQSSFQAMACFMITGMNHQWAATIERLAELDRSQVFVELDVALKALPGDVPDAHRAAVAHWRAGLRWSTTRSLKRSRSWLLPPRWRLSALPTSTCWVRHW